jgi:hypothetical protein
MAKIQARVLTDCMYGKCDDVVEMDKGEAKAAEAAGFIDSNKDAVAYALTLPQNEAVSAMAADPAQ